VLIKQIQFRGSDDKGNVFCQPLLGGGLEKTASVEMRSKLHPLVQDFVSAVRPTPGGIYVLVNALGAGEYWGSNINGDLFPEKALIHAPPNWEQLSPEEMRQVGPQWPYGFPTFMGAFPYKHHANKDPSRAFGRVELAVWNPTMHRVELIVYLDRALCMQFDAYDIIERIERGEFPDVSMGCRVPFDVCTICEHQSKTRNDYCEHAATMMNKILPDGRKVAVRNDTPRFFDISFVFIGADKTAKVMAKLAQQGQQVCLGSYCTVPRLSVDVGARFSKEANDPIKKKITVHGMKIGIEWPDGSLRQYRDKKTGKVNYEKKMKADYGYIFDTKDADGEELDVYVGPDKESDRVYVVRQLKDDGSFDEHKVMLGYASSEEAKSSYLAHMPSKRFDSMEGMGVAEFKKTYLKDAKEMAKEAATSCGCHGLGDDCGGGLDKLAAAIFPIPVEKSASHRKIGELIKSVPAGPFTKETLPTLEKTERDIPTDVLDLMGGMGYGPAASTTGMMGIVLKPREFQRMMLVGMGDGEYANELDAKNMTFGQTQDIDDSIPVDPGLSDERLQELLLRMGFLGDRSAASPALRKRVAKAPKNVDEAQSSTNREPVMQKLAAAYNGYRRNLVKQASQIDRHLALDPQLRSELFGHSMAQAFAGGVEKTGNASVFGPDSLAYLVGAYHENRGIHTSSPEVVASLALTGGFKEMSV
jgi:hypothetical protein